MKIVTKMKTLLLFATINVLTIGSANAYLLNLDATKNGYSKPITLDLTPGTYEIKPVSGTYKAWSAWDLNDPKKPLCTDPNGCDRSVADIWGWLNSYAFESPDLTDVIVNGISVLPDANDRVTVNQKIAYPNASTALANAWSAEFTLLTNSTVSFMITDNSLGNNIDGMSLHVVPEPSILALLSLGLVGIGFTRRKKS